VRFFFFFFFFFHNVCVSRFLIRRRCVEEGPSFSSFGARSGSCIKCIIGPGATESKNTVFFPFLSSFSFLFFSFYSLHFIFFLLYYVSILKRNRGPEISLIGRL
jgi:hypothetical protein